MIDVKAGILSRNNDDLLKKVQEYERENVKIGAKVFLNQPHPALLHEAIDTLLGVLQTQHLDNLILAYHPNDDSESKTNGNADAKFTNGHHNGTPSFASSLPKESLITWGGGDTGFDDLMKLWQVLESYAGDRRINQLGVADLDTDTLIDLYKACKIKPTIAQINLNACCVVPPSMQEFCTKNEIQLLTHSDSDGKLTRFYCQRSKPISNPMNFFLSIFSNYFKEFLQRTEQRFTNAVHANLDYTLPSAH